MTANSSEKRQASNRHIPGGKQMRKQEKKMLAWLRQELGVSEKRLPWYESTLFWGALSVGVGLVIAVMTSKEAPIWLLAIAWPFFCFACWAIFKNVKPGRKLWLLMGLSSLIVGAGLTVIVLRDLRQFRPQVNNSPATPKQQEPNPQPLTTAAKPSLFGECKYSLEFRQEEIHSVLGSPFGQMLTIIPREIQDEVFPFVRFRATEPITGGSGLGVIIKPGTGDPKAAGISIRSGHLGIATEKDGTAELWLENQQKFSHSKEVVVLLFGPKPFTVVCAEQLPARQYKVAMPSTAPKTPPKEPIHWSQKTIPSDDGQWKFRTLLTIQTDEDIQNPNFKIICDVPCSFGKFEMGVNAVYGTNRAVDDRSIEAGIRQSFTPRTPLTMDLYANEALRILKVERIY